MFRYAFSFPELLGTGPVHKVSYTEQKTILRWSSFRNVFYGAGCRNRPAATKHGSSIITPIHPSHDHLASFPRNRSRRTVSVQAGQFLRVTAEQRGIDVVLSIIDPRGTLVVAADSYNGSFGPEPASIIADTTGTYRVQVSSFDPTYTTGKYVIEVTDSRDVSPQDENAYLRRTKAI